MGNYAITAAMGSLAAANYDFTFVNGTLMVLASTTGNATTIGLVDPLMATVFLRNSNDSGFADTTFQYGFENSGWLTIAGDWNGDGIDTVGLYNPTTSTYYLRNGNSTGYGDVTFQYGFGNSGWLTIVGDWNGDGKDTIGQYNPETSTFYLRNSNSKGEADVTFVYGDGGAGWLPIAGDWNGDGKETIGLYNPNDSVFFLKNTNTTGYADVTFCYGPADADWTPIAGDWNGDGNATVGLYAPTSSVFYLRNTNTIGYADLTFSYGDADSGWTPLAGVWVDTQPLMAAGNAVTASADVSVLTEAALEPILQEAIARWAAAGLDAASLAKLSRCGSALATWPARVWARPRPTRSPSIAMPRATAGSSIPRRHRMKSSPPAVRSVRRSTWTC